LVIRLRHYTSVFSLLTGTQVDENRAPRTGIGPVRTQDSGHPGQQVFHGYVRSWSELRPEMQAALRRAGLVDARGIIAP